MSETTDTLKLIVPDAPGLNPDEAFDWEEFIRNNFLKIDGMKIVGNTLMVNAASYIDQTTGLFSVTDLKTDMADYIADGLFIYLQPGLYLIADSDDPDAGLMFGAEDTPLTYGSIHILAAKGAIISTQGPDGTGEQIVDILRIVNTDNVVITDLSILGKTATIAGDYSCGIKCENVKNLRIKGVDISNTGYGIVVEQSGVTESENVWITDCKIVDYNREGILLDQVINATVKDNYIARLGSLEWPGTSGEGNGITVVPGVSATPNTIKILDNTISMPRRNGVYIQHTALETGTIIVKNNTIEQPGNHQSAIPHTDEVTKATRGSGVFSLFTGQLDISHNTIVEPIAFGIYVIDAPKPLIDYNNITMAGGRDSELHGHSWHGISVIDCTKPRIFGNIVLGDWLAGHDEFESEYRRGIYVYDSASPIITGNHLEWDIYVHGCDHANVYGNWADMDTPGFSRAAVTIKHEVAHPSEYPSVVGNTCIINGISAYGIKFEGASATGYVTCIGNNSTVYWGYKYDNASVKARIYGNLGGTIGETPGDIFLNPEISMDSNGRLKGGTYTEDHFIRPADMQVGPNTALAIDSATKLPILRLDKAYAGEPPEPLLAYALISFQPKNFKNTGSNTIGLRVFYSGINTEDGSKVATINISYLVINPKLYNEAGDSFHTDSFVPLTEQTRNIWPGMNYTTFNIPNAVAAANNKIISVLITRNCLDPNDTLTTGLQIAGIQASWTAAYPTA